MTRECFTVDEVAYDTDDTDDATLHTPNDSRPLATCPLRVAEGWSIPWDRERPLLGQLARGTRQRGIGASGSAGDLQTLKESAHICSNYADHARGVAALLANIRRIEPDLRFLRDYARVAEVAQTGRPG